MPTYTFDNTKTKKSFTEFMTIAEMETLLQSNRNLRLAITAPQIVSGVSAGHNKPDSGFRDILKTIKKRNRGSKINTF